jgi:30S ribosomal protein S31
LVAGCFNVNLGACFESVSNITSKESIMGKGDRRTTKGKRNISSYGKSRPNVVAKTTVGKPVAAVKAAAPAKKAPAKKAAAK